jgi:hypothetical protein
VAALVVVAVVVALVSLVVVGSSPLPLPPHAAVSALKAIAAAIPAATGK